MSVGKEKRLVQCKSHTYLFWRRNDIYNGTMVDIDTNKQTKEENDAVSLSSNIFIKQLVSIKHMHICFHLCIHPTIDVVHIKIINS